MAVRDKQSDPCLLAVIGGGAAGLTAAITAAAWLAEQSPSVLDQLRESCGLGQALPIIILEKNDRAGRRLLVTGNGRCNLSHQPLDHRHYFSQSAPFIQGPLQRFDLEATLDWFSRIGLACRTEPDGRVFPNSLQAASVLDILRQEAERLGIEIITDCDVEQLRESQPLYLGDRPLDAHHKWQIKTRDRRTFIASRVVVATGGLSYPSLGGSESGHQMMRQLGYPVTRMFPSIVQIKTETDWVRGLAGSKFEGRAALLRDGSPLRCEDGEVLFTRYGVSGPPVLQLARPVSACADDPASLQRLRLELDFLPDWTDDACLSWMIMRRHHHPSLELADFMTGLLPKRIGQALLKLSLNRSLGLPCSVLTKSDYAAIVHQIHHTQLAVEGTLGWDQAQVTAGGLDVSSFRPDTLASRRHEGLYAAGELLDVDGDCGGYNLQWAWSSGHLAGLSAVRDLVAANQNSGRSHTGRRRRSGK